MWSWTPPHHLLSHLSLRHCILTRSPGDVHEYYIWRPVGLGYSNGLPSERMRHSSIPLLGILNTVSLWYGIQICLWAQEKHTEHGPFFARMHKKFMETYEILSSLPIKWNVSEMFSLEVKTSIEDSFSEYMDLTLSSSFLTLACANPKRHQWWRKWLSFYAHGSGSSHRKQARGNELCLLALS